jgi:hypothetical protein
LIVVAHIPPLPRIDLGARPAHNEPVVIDHEAIFKVIEQERIWQLVRQAAGAEV